MKRLFVLLLAILTISACNTVEGFGKDVKKVGSKMEDAAKR